MCLSDTWLNLVSHELTIVIKSLFSFFHECPNIINSPSCCVSDAWNALSKFVSSTWNIEISFMISLQLLLISSFLWVYDFLDFAELNLFHLIKIKVYVKNDFDAANTTLLSSKLVFSQWNYLRRQWEIKLLKKKQY